jgi:hypothetical protein
VSAARIACLALALLVFGLLSFGQNATARHEPVASLYGYFGATVILMLFVRTLPPYSSNRLGGRRAPLSDHRQ